MINVPKKNESVRFKNYKRKIKSSFMIYTDCVNILVPKNNGKQNPDESYTNKYQKHVACSYGYKLVSVDDKFSKSLKSSLSVKMKSMIKKSKYCSDV